MFYGFVLLWLPGFRLEMSVSGVSLLHLTTRSLEMDGPVTPEMYVHLHATRFEL
jgi:hypothetical protein